jgi:hypothetical protein
MREDKNGHDVESGCICEREGGDKECMVLKKLLF